MSATRSRHSIRRSAGPRAWTEDPPGVVRLARVREARRRIAERFYDRSEVRERLVEAVLAEIRRR
ncbi:MAG TPA: hypothetical protein VGU27_11515 [Candidatus Eisenbacteria bacterium]|nr:hypothetical protein [Candidatus Eisenbacteria bacterium]